MQLEIEREAIKREDDKQKLSSLKVELANLSEQRDEFMAKWKAEKDVIDTMQNAKEEIEQAKLQAEQAERAGDYGKVAELRYGKIKELEAAVEEGKAKLAELQSKSKMIKEEVEIGRAHV